MHVSGARIVTILALAALMATAPVAAQVESGYGGFFWFDSQKISAAGNSFYGAYAYRHLLPAFAPKSRASTSAFAYFDGDFLPQSPLDIPHQSSEASVADQARRLENLAYVIAVYSYQANPPFREVDNALRAAGTTGYLGLTTRAPLSLEAFIELTHLMSLPVALKQEGAVLRIADFAFISTADLRKMGFEPQVAR